MITTDMDLKETGSEVMEWIHVVEDTVHCPALMNMVMNLRVP
jgi:hypothetical protein